MEYSQMLPVLFYIWWIVLNGLLYTAEFCFIQNFTGIREKKFMTRYVLLSSLLTLLVMYYQSPGIFRLILHTGIIFCFSRFVLRLNRAAAIAPVMIILTLFTFMEGYQAIIMRWLVQQRIGAHAGVIAQMILSGALVLLLAAALQFVSKKYAYTGRQKLSSYLYTLLFPCIFIVWVIRSGLGLDRRMNTSFPEGSNLWALAWILGACIIFFIILGLDGKIIALSIQETEQKRLEDQIKKQYIYVQEAKKRNEQYRTFQHDINNHFLVLSGLIREKKYSEAEAYFGKLYTLSDQLLVGIETGNPIVDILLNEKINFAKSNGIEVKQDVQIPPDCSVEDMDLCIILANAIDNAVQACMKETDIRPEISIILRQRHKFLIFEAVNTCTIGPSTLKYGTGLKNMARTVEKYEGTMEIETNDQCFRLTILLCMLPSAKEE